MNDESKWQGPAGWGNLSTPINTNKKLTCIECPRGCALSIDIQKGKVVAVSGNACPKGDAYARVEIESPVRVLTSTVMTHGFPLRMVPVKTSGPIPKAKIKDAMAHIKKLKVARTIRVGEVLAENFLGLGVNLVITRDCGNWENPLEYAVDM